MSKYEIDRKLLFDTLEFLLGRRNVALFRIHNIRSKVKKSNIQLETERKIARNLRRRIVREITKNKDLLTAKERRQYLDEDFL